MAFISATNLTPPPRNELRLIQFETYEEYLDTLYNELDKCYLPDKPTCRKIAEFGYRRDGQTFSKEEFYEKRTKVAQYLSPVPLNVSASAGFRFGDPAQKALAIRERANRVGVLNTIIYVNYTTGKGREVSGYIDYAHSLLKKDWKKFFRQNTPIYPDKHDLGYYDWKYGVTHINDSLYLKTLMSPNKGLVFQHKYDRMLIIPDPFAQTPGAQTIRTRIKTKMYNSFVVIDHTLRCRK